MPLHLIAFTRFVTPATACAFPLHHAHVADSQGGGRRTVSHSHHLIGDTIGFALLLVVRLADGKLWLNDSRAKK